MAQDEIQEFFWDAIQRAFELLKALRSEGSLNVSEVSVFMMKTLLLNLSEKYFKASVFCNPAWLDKFTKTFDWGF